MRKPFIVLALVLSLAGCAQIQSAIELIPKATQTFTNPLGPVDIYRVKNVYAAGLELAVQYRSYCWARPYATLMADPIARPLCQDRRAVVRAVQSAKGKASSAIKAADSFIRNNPSGNAVTYIGAAWDAVNQFKNSIPVVK